MFKDTLKIITFTLELIKNKQVKQKPCIEIYDLFRHMHTMQGKMDLLITMMQRDWREYNENTQHGSRMKKWVVFVNQDLDKYIEAKYKMFCKILRLESTPFMYHGVLTKNFYKKELGCKPNQYLSHPQFDDEMNLTLYRFNFMELEQRNYLYSDEEIEREELWSESFIPLQDDAERASFIDAMQKDLEIFTSYIFTLEDMIQKQCTVDDLLMKNDFNYEEILYLDDIRFPQYVNEYIIVRNYKEAVEFVEMYGIPRQISFDHDLGMDEDGNILPSGYDFAKWLVEMGMNGRYTIPEDFEFTVHSANPVGKENIESYLNNYLQLRGKIL